MAYYRRRFYRRPAYRRNYRRRTNLSRPYSNVRKSFPSSRVNWKSSVVPDVQHVKMKYHCQFTLDAVHYESQFFRANSVFDCDPTTGGSQPVTFDDFAALYQRYYVVASAIKVKYINLGTQHVNIILRPKLDNSTTPWTIIQPADPLSNIDPALQPNTITKLLAPTTQGTGSTALFKMYKKTDTVYGVPSEGDLDFTAGTTQNPTRQWFWEIAAVDTSGSDTDLNVLCDVTVTYYVVWNQRTSNFGTD